ncbi:hypothetical protein K432DRAFT_447221 [Lepidopterella palustris CBS 459.81]|uniref:Uncharacterized protein n=1 Tax=Lepidopterella palustris CBS 459.81 TaxID=1314670 RepID=A0A8E2JA95_9PEZI|nr:hypothetical protein K432DRAFT_447221 [Lepidopterella palustris CBS 459.81]
MALIPRGDCGTNPNWQPTVTAYTTANTDQQMSSWWNSLLSTPHTFFANELGKSFGSHVNSFECGIGDSGSCIAPGCSAYQDAGDPVWAFQALMSVVNLNTLFNSIYTGISNGQQDFTDLSDQIALTFFPWKNPKFPFGDAAFWINAIISILFSIIPGISVPLKSGLTALTKAGVQQAEYSLQPAAPSNNYQTLLQMQEYAATFGQTSRATVESWANDTFAGREDSQNHTILDYLAGGAYIENTNIPSNSEIESFYKTQMISRTINAQWRTQKIFVTFTKTNNTNDTSGPAQTKYYSSQDGGVYYTYFYHEDGVLRGHIDKPWGLDNLNGSLYNITGTDITKASARAFKIGGFNFTRDMAFQQIEESVSSNGTLTPYLDGASWTGTWTIPVCDIGTHQWNTQYGKNGSRYGMLPCCCGPNCTDTATFVKAANMNNFQTLLRGCKEQLKDTDLDFNAIEYGFTLKHTCALGWAVSPIWKRVVGVILFPFTFWYVCIA